MNATANRHLARRKRTDKIFRSMCFGAAGFGVFLLVLLLFQIFSDGMGRLSFHFITDLISARPSKTGIWQAVVGSFYIMALTAGISIPIGVAAAVYLEEFNTRKTKLTQFIQLNISNLAGVPSIVYGLLGLAVFSRGMNLGPSILAGALTMSLLILPMIIIVTQESLKGVPKSYREASLGLGSTQWQAIRFQVLPHAAPGIMTGVILAASRAIGETAPLIVVGAVVGAVTVPSSIHDRYTALPLQIFSWSVDSKDEFHRTAASAIVVLMVALLALNSVAIFIRNRSAQKR